MKQLHLIWITMLIVSFSSCSKNDVGPENPAHIQLTPKAAELIQTNNDFGIQLFTRVATTGGNMMLSPLSAGVALSMVLNGSNGETFGQIKDALQYPENMTMEEINLAYGSLVKQLLQADPHVNLSLANAMFYRNGFSINPPFANALSTHYAAHVQGLDFNHSSAVTAINKWAADKTNNKITRVIEYITAETMLFVMNALYFKGTWSTQFEKNQTALRPFHLDTGQTVQVNTMKGKVNCRIHYTSEYSAVELPYGRKNFSMIVIVPRTGHEALLKKLTPEEWRNITGALGSSSEWSEKEVLLPKFRFSYEEILNEALESLGMADAFNPRKADFASISDSPLYISFVKQNTFVDVNEEGTEAAAVTTVAFEITSAGPQFVVDKPFVFAIRERTTNTLMFIGSVSNPLD
jgi:serpin B